MRRFVTLLVLLLSSVPFGVSISGCAKTAAPVYCNGGDSGITTGQITTIVLQPLVYGVSLNYAEIGQLNTPSATDCHSTSISAQFFTFGTTDMTIADVQPTSGRICAGTWNRNSGGGIPDYTYCIPTNKSGTAYIEASANGVTSNPVPIFVHPVVTGIVLGGPATGGAATITAWSIVNAPPAQPLVAFTAQNSFSAGQVVSLTNFPASTFFNGITGAVVQSAGLSSTQFTVAIPGFNQPTGSSTETGLAVGPGCTTNPSTDCCPLGINPVTASPYLTNSCVSQGTTTQLVAGLRGDGRKPVQYQLPGGPSAVHRAGRRIADKHLAHCQHRPERRGHGQPARIGADHGEHLGRGELGGVLFHLPARIDHAILARRHFQSGGRQREQSSAPDGNRRRYQWQASYRTVAGVRFHRADHDSREFSGNSRTGRSGLDHRHLRAAQLQFLVLQPDWPIRQRQTDYLECGEYQHPRNQ